MIMQKLTTIVRGSARETAELVIDANAIRIFEQEICDCEMGIRKAKASLTVVVAEKIKLQRQLDQSQQTIRMREEQALEAIKKNIETLAEELAQTIATEEQLSTDLESHLKQLEQQEHQLSQQLQSTVQKIQAYRRDLELAKATESSQQACQKLHGQHGELDLTGNKLEDSLQRIKHRQQHFSDRLEAAQQVHTDLNSGGLDAKLSQHNIGQEDRVKLVLERLKHQAEQ